MLHITKKIEQDDFKDVYERYTNLAFHRRGAIINETIMLERLIDDYIASYFCGNQDKKVELLELIICTNRMIFENKVQVAKNLLEKQNPEIIKTNPKLIKDITDLVIPERNIFAHYWLVTSEEMSDWILQEKTVFVKFKNTTEYIEYDPDKFGNIMKTIGNGIRVFLSLQK